MSEEDRLKLVETAKRLEPLKRAARRGRERFGLRGVRRTKPLAVDILEPGLDRLVDRRGPDRCRPR